MLCVICERTIYSSKDCHLAKTRDIERLHLAKYSKENGIKMHKKCRRTLYRQAEARGYPCVRKKECSICYDVIRDDEAVLDCSFLFQFPFFITFYSNKTLLGCHSFHFVCIGKWHERESSCPLCKSRTSRVKHNGMWKEVEPKIQRAVYLEDNEHENEEETTYISTLCEICGDGGCPELMLLCDQCDLGFHTHCIGIDGVPNGDFYCRRCFY